jgi:hypothetical protein
MTIEAAALISADEQRVLCWHLPAGRTSASVPDTTDLLELLLRHRPHMAGTAHSHPGDGVPGPSWTDVTTYAALEKYFRRRFKHWIASMDRMVSISWAGPDRYDYAVTVIAKDEEPAWAAELRQKSRGAEPAVQEQALGGQG